MRILLLHSDEFEYVPKKKAIKAAEEISKEPVHVDEALVVMMAVESSDEQNYAGTVNRTVKEIEAVAQEVKADKIVCYPWVHLTSNPSRPDIALKIMRQIEEDLKQKKIYSKVLRAPFGWYKGFTVKVKGHPLSELSREFTATGESSTTATDTKSGITESKAIAKEEETKHEFFVLEPKGELIPFKEYKFNRKSDFFKFFSYETQKSRTVDKPPAHVSLMKRLELVDYEPASDGGNMRWYPLGWTMKRLIENHVTDTLVAKGANVVETPIMYDFKHPSLEAYMNRFPARQYTLQSGTKNYFLRFAACFGQFLVASDATISYKNLPLKLFEMTHYSFRREQSGELAALRRLRTFSMPDQHTFTADLDMAKDEFKDQYGICVQMMNDFDLNYEAVFRFQTDFYNDNKKWVDEMVQLIDRPVMIELFDKRYAYFVCKFEFNVVDGQKKAAALSTVQIDVENAHRFEVEYTDKDGQVKTPYILHASMSGAVERVIYGILEQAAKKITKGLKPSYPFWLAPIQVRICPVTDAHHDYAEKMYHKLNENGIRTDFDDRGERVNRMIRDAERLWIPYIIIIGDKEIESGKFTARTRTGEEEFFDIDTIAEVLSAKMKGYPKQRLAISGKLSQRPIFHSAN